MRCDLLSVAGWIRVAQQLVACCLKFTPCQQRNPPPGAKIDLIVGFPRNRRKPIPVEGDSRCGVRYDAGQLTLLIDLDLSGR